MKQYDITKCTADIVQPKCALTVWAAQNKPFAVCNASLYDMTTRVPIGTIIEDGRLVHNDGNGYGFGIQRDGKADFGMPWDRTWKDYLTGYNSPVQNGAYVAPGFSDSYVFDCRLARIGIGRRSGRTYIVTDDNVTLREFAMNAIAQGLDTLVNLDGGGSRHLYYDGALIYQSVRVPYNAIAFFSAETKPEKQEPDKCQYPVPTRNLLIGARGDDVKWMQWHLAQKGFACSVDGVFGWATWQAVWNFQKTWTAWPDGICGPNTRRELLK